MHPCVFARKKWWHPCPRLCIAMASHPFVLTPLPPLLPTSRYVIYCRALKKEQGFRSVLDELSPDLRGQLTLHCYGPAIACVPFFTPRLQGLSGKELRDAQVESKLFAQQVPYS